MRATADLDEAPVAMGLLRRAVEQRGDHQVRSGAPRSPRVGRWPYLACSGEAAHPLTRGTDEHDHTAEDPSGDERGGRP